MFTLQSGTYHGSPYTFEAVTDDTVPSYLWPGGYDASYITPDGDVLCGRCARAAFTDDTSPDHDNAIAGMLAGPCEEHTSEHSTGLMCDQCNEWIIAPHCVECSREYNELPVQFPRFPMFCDDSGSVLICPHCLAKEVASGRATKAGKRTYTLTGDQWYRVNHPTTFSR